PAPWERTGPSRSAAAPRRPHSGSDYLRFSEPASADATSPAGREDWAEAPTPSHLASPRREREVSPPEPRAWWLRGPEREPHERRKGREGGGAWPRRARSGGPRPENAP